MGLFKEKPITIENCTLNDNGRRYHLSNGLIAGKKNQGRDSLIKNLLLDSIINDKAIFVLQNGNAFSNNTIKNEFSSRNNICHFFEIDISKQLYSGDINLFKGSEVDFVKELMLLLVNAYKDSSADFITFVERFLNEVFHLLSFRLPPVKKFKLASLSDFDKIWMEDEANRLSNAGVITINERDRILRYTNNLSMFVKEINEYENFCKELEKRNFASLLSGDISYDLLTTKKSITFITLDFIAAKKQSIALLKLFIHKAIYEMKKANTGITFILEDIDLSVIEDCKDLLMACSSGQQNNVFFTIDNISKFQNLGFDPRTYANSFFVFRQNVKADADEWANTSGTYKKDKATQTTSTYKQVYGDKNKGFIGGVINIINRNKQVVTNTNHEIVDEHNVLPTEFMSLGETTSQVIILENSGSMYLRKIDWGY